MPFEIVRNDITKMTVDAIVNTANPRPVIGAGTDAVIHEAAGPGLLTARQKIGKIPTGSTKAEIKQYIEENFRYDLSRTCDEIRPGYHHVETCQETVPEAITAFLEGESFEDVIRTAVSLGGDCDTLTAIAGSIAEGFYGVPEELKQECRKRLPEPLLRILDRYEEYRSR